MQEVERKWLIGSHFDPMAFWTAGYPQVEIEQGYLCVRPEVRVRIEDQRKATLTYKSAGKEHRGALARREWSIKIPLWLGRLLFILTPYKIDKVRYRVGPFEVDRFRGMHWGLWLVEWEAATPSEALPVCPFPLGREVTHNKQYKNVALAVAGRIPEEPL